VDDARRILDDAVRERRPCRVARLEGAWTPATLVGLEQAGLVVVVPNHGMRGGEEVRLWFEEQGRPLYFEASVLRTGVPVPDRSGHGLLLGFLAPVPVPVPVPLPVPGAGPTAPAMAGAPLLEIRVASGTVSLLAAPVQVVSLAPDRLEFQVPRSYTVVFPEQSVLRLRLGARPSDAYEARGRVNAALSGDGHVLYRVTIEEVERADLHQQAVPALRAALGR
jgi:hypothetical protein